jgi:hypothetical protein
MYQNPWLVEKMTQQRQQEIRHEAEQVRIARAAQTARRDEVRPRWSRAIRSRVLKQATLILTAIVTGMFG